MATDSAAELTREYWIGKSYRAIFTSPRPERASVLHMTCEWLPVVPDRLTAQELDDYRRARDAFIGELMTFNGGSALVLEV